MSDPSQPVWHLPHDGRFFAKHFAQPESFNRWLIEWTSPQEFMARAFVDPVLVMADTARFDAMFHRLAAEEPTDPLLLVKSKATGHVVGLDGLHRAAAAYYLGMTRVPMLVVEVP